MLWLLVGTVAAAPPRPLLGPDGPRWLGPLPPGEGAATVVVDPADRGLYLELPDSEGKPWVWDPATAVPDALGGGHSLTLDDAGRPERIGLAGGAELRVRWSGETTVGAIYGPGAAVLRLSEAAAGGAGGLEAVDAQGHVLRLMVESLEGGGERRTVQSSTGRVVRVRTDELGRLVEWTDPRGLTGRVSWSEDGAVATAPGGGRWTLDLDENGLLVGVQSPLGHAVRSGVSADGRLLVHEDPLGRVHTVNWTEAGTVRSVDGEGGRLVLERDESQRLTGIQRAGGTGVRVGWGEDGRVARLEDGAGATLSFERDPLGRVAVIQTRAGGRWSVERDGAGRVKSVVAPTGERWRVERDAVGRVRTLLAAGGERTAWQRDAGGRVSRIKAADGRVTGISRDAAGRIRELRPSGSLPLTIQRGPAGEVSAVRTGAVQVRIARDAGGRPVGAGPIAWAYDGDGRVAAVRSPVLALQLDRSPTGALTGVATPDGSWQLAVERDPGDRPVAWRGTDGAVEVERDADGRIRVERGPAGELLVGRDGRGLVDRIEGDRGLWRWMRDASGAVLRVLGPDGPAVGVVRDATGRSVLERLPGGHMLLRAFRSGGTETEVHDSADQTLLAHALGQDALGNVRWTEVLGEPRQTWTLDGLARLVSRVGTDERAWSFGPGTDQGPDGEVLLTDRVGRLQEASLDAELPVFGVGRQSVALHRDPLGRIEAVAGDEGQARLHHDALGRLAQVEVGGAEWRVRWDARGRPGLVTWPGGEGQGLLWAPAPVERGVQPALAVGPGLVRALLPSPRGPLGWSTADGGVGAYARLPVDGPVLELTGGEVVEQRALPRGAGTTAGSLAFTGHDRLQLFGGGPSVSGDGRSLDPLLGQSTSGLLPWPWAHDRSSERALLDPASWAPEGSWHDPVALLVSLGELRLPRLPEALPTVAAPEPALAWLPASLDQSPPVVQGPGRPVGRIGGMTEDEEQLLQLLVAHLLDDAGPLPASILPGALLELPAFADLPPELALIGAPRWEERSLDPWTGRFSLARWGPPP